jgi:uncharacterized protein YegL
MTALVSGVSFPAFGGGILHAVPPEIDGQMFAVARPACLLSRSLVTVSEDYLEHRLDQVFFNNNEFPLRSVYLLPMPVDTTPRDVVVLVNGVAHPFDMPQDRDLISELRSLVMQVKDPALLELADRTVLRIPGVSLGVKQQVSISVRFRYPSAVEDNSLGLRLSLAGERYSLGPVGELEIRVRFTMDRPVRAVLSPSHQLWIMREAPHRCLVRVRLFGERIREDFVLETTFGSAEPDFHVFTHKAPGKPGYFMAVIVPPLRPHEETEPARDIVFVVDNSGSMKGKWLETAKQCVHASLRKLGSDDRFNVVTIGTKTKRLAPTLMRPTRHNILNAVKFVDSLHTAGGTDLYDGLAQAFELFRSRRRSSAVMLLTDGRSSVGVTDPEQMIERLTRHNRAGARVLALALGSNPSVAFLGKLAAVTKGRLERFSGSESVTELLDRKFGLVAQPILSDLMLTVEGVSINRTYPDPLPEIFRREPLLVLGQYSCTQTARARVKLRARLYGDMTVTEKIVRFPKDDAGHAYLPALLGMRRLADLLETKLTGRISRAQRQTASGLVQQLGFVVPGLPDPGGTDARDTGMPAEVGETLWLLKTSTIPKLVTGSDYVRVGDKVFRQTGTGWTDTGYRPGMTTREVPFMDDSYFALLEARPKIGKYFALSPEVTFTLDREAVRIRMQQ